MNIDLVQIQLGLSNPSATLKSLGLGPGLSPTTTPPNGHAIQLRLTAEDPSNSFRLSVGCIRPEDVNWPGGRGIRVDTWLAYGGGGDVGEIEEIEWEVGTEFDSLLGKIIVHGATFEEATYRAIRALREFRLSGSGSGGVKTNVGVLAGVVGHRDWMEGSVDTSWLERNVGDVIELGGKVLMERERKRGVRIGRRLRGTRSKGSLNPGTTTTTIQPGAIFHLTLGSPDTTDLSGTSSTKHTMTLSSIAHNTFPEHLSGTLQTTLSTTPLSFSLSQSSSAGVSSSTSFDLADLNDPNHIASPLTGKIVELHPALSAGAVGGAAVKIKQGDTLVVLSVMKMENVITAPRDGVVSRVGRGVNVGVVIGEGMLLAVVVDEHKSRL